MKYKITIRSAEPDKIIGDEVSCYTCSFEAATAFMDKWITEMTPEYGKTHSVTIEQVKEVNV